MPRYQNVHALVNAGFLFRINRQNYLVEERPVIVYGHINDKFVSKFLFHKEFFIVVYFCVIIFYLSSKIYLLSFF